jgi:surface-adhesin protein E
MLIATRKAVEIFLLAAVSSTAMAEWVEVGRSESETLYVDPSTITIRGTANGARMWALKDFNAPQRLGRREPFKSEKVEREYDCELAQSRLLYFTSHSENMAGGEVVDFNFVPGDWTPVPPDTGLDELWKIACGKA